MAGKKKRKYASQSRGGCRRSENGEGLIRLGVIYLKVVTKVCWQSGARTVCGSNTRDSFS